MKLAGVSRAAVLQGQRLVRELAVAPREEAVGAAHAVAQGASGTVVVARQSWRASAVAARFASVGLARRGCLSTAAGEAWPVSAGAGQ